MPSGNLAKTLGLVLAALVVGSLVGPRIASAVGSLVTIKGAGSTNKAKVDNRGELLAATSARTSSVVALTSSRFDSIFAITEPSGETVLVSGHGNVHKSTGRHCSDIVGVSLDVPTAGTQPVRLILRRSSVQGSGKIIWQGTVQSAGHIDYTFGQSILICPGTNSGFNTTVVNNGGATVQYEVYGFGFGTSCCAATKREWIRLQRAAPAPPG
jgi:hypothetical protein